MAYMKTIEKPRCRCGKPATKEVFNRYNAPCGKFCARDAAIILAALKINEEKVLHAVEEATAEVEKR